MDFFVDPVTENYLVFVVGAGNLLDLDLIFRSVASSRASEMGSNSKLRRAGATNVIMPERMGGQRMARLVTQPNVLEFMEYILLKRNSDVSIHEVHYRKMCATNLGKNIGEP